MCLITVEKEPKIAEEDIKAYKILHPDQHACFYSDMCYELGRKYETILLTSPYLMAFDEVDVAALDKEFGKRWNSPELKAIGQGFHGVFKLERAKKNIQNSVYHRAIFTCIIPKGSEYYTNISGLFVSNSIIIKEKIHG